MAANGMFGAGKNGMINPPDRKQMFALSMVEIAVFNRKAYMVIRDLKLLLSIIKVNKDIGAISTYCFVILFFCDSVIDHASKVSQINPFRLRKLYGNRCVQRHT